MPYLFWKKSPVESTNSNVPGPARLINDPIAPTAANATGDTSDTLGAATEETVQLGQPLQSGQERHIVHESMTLDQYYYVSLEDTSVRDKDQVLWRSTDPELKQRGSGKKDEGRRSISHTRASREPIRAGAPQYSVKGPALPDTEARKILIVNQLWLWTLDESITHISILFSLEASN
jgi:hypothetical protein